MRKLKDLSLNEKLMISFVIILLLGIAVKWKGVKDGFFNGWNKYTEQTDK